MWMPGTSFSKRGDCMTNDEKIALYNELGKKISQLHAERKWEERNTIVPQFREIYKEIDWGFKQGDRAMIPEGKRKVPVKILKHQEDNYYHVLKDGGGDIVLPGTLLFPYIETAPESVEPEQMSLF